MPRKEISRRYMTSDAEWAYLVLPMKRYTDNFMQTAVLLNPVKPVADTVVLYEGSCFTEVNLRTARKFKYSTLEACLDDGWMVD